VKHCPKVLGDLSIEMAREWIIEKITLAACPLTSEITEEDQKALLLQHYQLSDMSLKSMVWEWLMQSCYVCILQAPADPTNSPEN
jgi:hypothetical protein